MCFDVAHPNTEASLPYDHTAASVHVSLRIPGKLVDAFQKPAEALERPRSWVMVRAFASTSRTGKAPKSPRVDEIVSYLHRFSRPLPTDCAPL